MTADPAASDAPIARRANSTSETSETVETVETSERPAKREKQKLRGWKAFLRDILVILVAAIVVSFLIKTFLIRSFYIPSESMNDTLQVNDRIIVNELVPDLVPVTHGDIVVFKDPGGWLDNIPSPAPQNPVAGFFDWLLSIVGITAPDSDDHLIKRVIGLPGDHVTCCNSLGQLSVNDVPINEPYVKLPAGVTKVSADDFDVTVPKNSLWVMGDNRYDSRDSRYNRDKPGNGFVPYDNVVGKAFVISWPTSRWTWLDNYPLVWADVKPAESTSSGSGG